MSLRLAISGYGAVAAIHARRLREVAAVELTAVYGPNAAKAQAFADAHGIAAAMDSLGEALRTADAVMVCSPSELHAEQAMRALDAGVHALVELPACRTVEEAEALAGKARSRGLVLQCAHTSRHLAPYARVACALREGALGRIEQVRYTRQIALRPRSWRDDALLHHAEHPLDLCRWWFGEVRPLGCAAHPEIDGCQNVSLLGELAGGAPLAISISYTARLPGIHMTVIGSEHTVETDGFGYLRSDLAELRAEYDAQETYECAIRDQDAMFVARCAGAQGGVPWEDTVALTALVERFRALWRNSR